MSIRVTCPHCAETFGVHDKHAGLRGRCPRCSGAIEVPSAAPAKELDTSWLDDLDSVAPAAAPAKPKPQQAAPPSKPARPAQPAPATGSPARIRFNCQQCGAAFAVGAQMAGRSAKCQKCGASVRIPSASAPAAPRTKAEANSPFAAPGAKPTAQRSAAPPPEFGPSDDLLSELDGILGGDPLAGDPLGAAAGSPLAPLAPAKSRGKTKKAKSKSGGARGGLKLGVPDYVFLGAIPLGILLTLGTGLLSFISSIPQAAAALTVVVMCLMNQRVLLGVGSFCCGLMGFVVGWMNANEWGLLKVMLGWTLCIVLWFPLQAIDMMRMIEAVDAAAQGPLGGESFEMDPSGPGLGGSPFSAGNGPDNANPGMNQPSSAAPNDGAANSQPSAPTSPTAPASDAIETIDQALAALQSNNPNPGLAAIARMSPGDRHGEVMAAVAPLVRHNDTTVRRQALTVFGLWGTEKELPAMIGALDDADASIRRDAMQIVAAFENPQAAAAIAERLPHDPHDAGQALRGMGAVAEPAVVRYLHDNNADLRRAACEILEEIGTGASVGELSRLEKDADRGVAQAATKALRSVRTRHKLPGA